MTYLSSGTMYTACRSLPAPCSIEVGEKRTRPQRLKSISPKRRRCEITPKPIDRSKLGVFQSNFVPRELLSSLMRRESLPTNFAVVAKNEGVYDDIDEECLPVLSSTLIAQKYQFRRSVSAPETSTPTAGTRWPFGPRKLSAEDMEKIDRSEKINESFVRPRASFGLRDVELLQRGIQIPTAPLDQTPTCGSSENHSPTAETSDSRSQMSDVFFFPKAPHGEDAKCLSNCSETKSQRNALLAPTSRNTVEAAVKWINLITNANITSIVDLMSGDVLVILMKRLREWQHTDRLENYVVSTISLTRPSERMKAERQIAKFRELAEKFGVPAEKIFHANTLLALAPTSDASERVRAENESAVLETLHLLSESPKLPLRYPTFCSDCREQASKPLTVAANHVSKSLTAKAKVAAGYVSAINESMRRMSTQTPFALVGGRKLRHSIGI
eukprot:GEMP01026089.1.p1 GENE.GEMP01026089.1~~GEMP01026089.1.p1  ORF type:complete len:443 (+),score=92.95 GEMP01026089.1:52-1380(+)